MSCGYYNIITHRKIIHFYAVRINNGKIIGKRTFSNQLFYEWGEGEGKEKYCMSCMFNILDSTNDCTFY